MGIPRLATADGSITRCPLPDDRGEVTVVLHATNALAIKGLPVERVELRAIGR